MTTDQAVYVSFQRTAKHGTELIATRGYNGPKIAHLVWERILSNKEEHELDAAVRCAAALGVGVEAR